MFVFRRLKINHDTHEFILDSGTVANKYALQQMGTGYSAAEFAEHSAAVWDMVLCRRVSQDTLHGIGTGRSVSN